MNKEFICNICETILVNDGNRSSSPYCLNKNCPNWGLAVMYGNFLTPIGKYMKKHFAWKREHNE